MPRGFWLKNVLCLIAAAGFACVCATASDAARHRSSEVSKQKGSVGAKHRSSGSRHKSARHRGSKSRAEEKEKTELASLETPPAVHTPADKADCIAVSQTFYGRARTQAARSGQSIPKEFQRVVSSLDQLCGEEEFEKARVSIDWMDTCLKNFNKDSDPALCSRSRAYFCAIDATSEGCRAADGDSSGRGPQD
jgi:hypothetical protein